MSGNGLSKVLLLLCAAVLVAAVVMGLNNVFGGTGIAFANAEKYTAGNAEISNTVKNLDIEWTGGKVSIAYYGGSAIIISETSKTAISGDQQLHWWLDGETLRIRYEKPGIRLFNIWNQPKELTVTVPEGSVFGEVRISATSADMSIPQMKADRLLLTATSGDIVAAADAASLECTTTSGDQHLKLKGRMENILTAATSGNITIEAEEASAVKTGSTSGSVRIDADRIGELASGTTSGNVTAVVSTVDRMTVSSTSGTVNLSVRAFGSLKAASTSGSVTATLSGVPGFTARITTVSGSINTDLAVTKQGSSYSCGDGSGRAEITTTSGNVWLTGIKD